MKSRRPIIGPVVVLCLLFGLIACSDEEQSSAPAPPIGMRVALYIGHGADDICITASTKMFEWMGCEVTKVGPRYIIDNSLAGFDLVCFPGGDMYHYANDLGFTGRSNVKRFISGGGGYIGICGGAYFAANDVFWQGQRVQMTPLSLLPARAEGPLGGIPDVCMTNVLLLDKTHPITTDQPDTLSIIYLYGPAFTLDAGAEAEILGVYSYQRRPCMLAFEYGKGRVFIIGTHPEFEEDSDRDGTTVGEQYDDKGSEWELMRSAYRWCTGH